MEGRKGSNIYLQDIHLEALLVCSANTVKHELIVKGTARGLCRTPLVLFDIGVKASGILHVLWRIEEALLIWYKQLGKNQSHYLFYS